MSGLFHSLNASVMALSAHSRAIETAGKNLAHVNDPSYARQRVLLGDRGTVVTPDGASSLGLVALGNQQLRDLLLDRQVMRESSLSSAFSAEQKGYQGAQAALGQTIDRTSPTGAAGGGGVAVALDDFFNGFQSLASRPTDAGERQSLLQKAVILTERLQSTDRRLAQVQTDLDARITSDVVDVNRLLDTIAGLNAQIIRFEVSASGSAVDLRDQRQARLEELAARLPVEVSDLEGGAVQVATRDGGGGAVMLIDGPAVTGPVLFDGTQLTAGASATVLAPAAGSIRGSLTARDGAVQTLRDDLDLLAHQLVLSINAAYNPTGTTGDFFLPTGTAAGTIALAGSLSAATLKAGEGGGAGDNTLALAVAAIGTRSFSTAAGDLIDGTPGGFFSQAVSGLGQALAGANARVDDQANIERLTRAQRDAVSGVSLDEELADLMKYQRAFQASSRVFQTVDDLLDVVVNRLGRA